MARHSLLVVSFAVSVAIQCFLQGASVAAASVEPTARAEGPLTGTKFGIFYLFWHCIGTNKIYDISKNELGPVPEFHWWAQPQQGYYCPTRDRQVLRNHAIQLRDAGIDFVYLDISNFTDTVGQAQTAAIQPLQALLEEWSKIPGAPQIAPFLPLTAGATLPDTK